MHMDRVRSMSIEGNSRTLVFPQWSVAVAVLSLSLGRTCLCSHSRSCAQQDVAHPFASDHSLCWKVAGRVYTICTPVARRQMKQTLSIRATMWLRDTDVQMYVQQQQLSIPVACMPPV